jgi:hypothetical protein
MASWRYWIGAAAVSAAVACVPASATAVPTPSQEPFYAVPAGLAHVADGTILASRPVSVSAYSIPMAVQAWQVKYRTPGLQNRPSADVATIMVPNAPWRGSGPRPLVSYQVAEDGDGSQCAASYALREGLGAAGGNAELETGLMQLALGQGWAVVAPDYEGAGSDFLGANEEAHGVLDGIRAALHFSPDGLGAGTPLAMWGYSGGALASSLAAQEQPKYAPELHFAGIALGGEVASIQDTLDAFSGSAVGGAIVMGFASVNRSYPAAHLLQYLNAAGRGAVAQAQAECIAQAAIQFPFASAARYEAYPGATDAPAVVKLLNSISPLGIAGTPSAPVYDYHSSIDELAPVGPDRQLMQRYCAAGVRVDHVETLAGEHLLVTVTGAPGAVAYLAARFAGAPAPDDCASIP